MKIVMMEPIGVSDSLIESLAAPLKQEGHQLICYQDRETDPAKLAARIGDGEILIMANQPLGRQVLEQCENLKMISIGFTGVDHVDVEYCKSRGIVLCNAAGYSTNAVAELAFGMILSLYRKLPACEAACRAGGTKEGKIGFELAGKTLGIVGTGAIGSLTAKIGLAFGCRVVAFSRTEKEELKALGVEYQSLKDLLAESDIVSLHVPSTKETRKMIGKEELSAMKKSALLINTARGPVVDTEALAWALTHGQIAGAGIDVFDEEPPLEKDHILLHCPNTIVTPHVAFATKESMEKRAAIIFENIECWLKGTPQNLV